MVHDFADFCLWVYVIVDDILQQSAWLLKRPGPPPQCNDSELITMALVGECRGWDIETEMLSQWREHRDLFPHVPSQSRFNRRRRNLMLETIAEYFPSEASWTEPEGGLFLWVSLPEGINTTELLMKAVETQKVAYVPGEPFFPNEGGENTLRLNFSNATDENIVEGMTRLGKVFKEALA